MSASAAVVLLSVRPPHVDRLLDGSKTIELRRRPIRAAPGSSILLYASTPSHALVGSVLLEGTDVGSPEGIWRRYGADAFVTRKEFDDYFTGAAHAVALRVGSTRRLLRPVALKELRRRRPTFAPPQSFRFVYAEELSEILNGERRDLLH